MGVSGKTLHDMVTGLADVTCDAVRDYTAFGVRGTRFGYHWPRTETVGLKQTLSEQAALVAERPDVFEVQFTAGGFGWVVVRLTDIDEGELAELVYEAWRLSAPPELVQRHPFVPVGSVVH
ncbi:hypothetical protein B1813_01660 [Saccharomonospora piscinae]|uniref:YjbR protein n=1 Tax=Saccharomonospora piscinae TaxID=687388 RepID=A0A1V9ACG1_SACPI|nr:MmcQ/YjbR family DNA-binding protein [Saccharomonospora piscinae]OQO94817.1 hypothetical protein B1813_01660 [Saccharomonospora piscinae]